LPFLFERRFGIRAYDYWNGYTIAQIELMAADQPLVVYKKDKKKGSSKKTCDDIADRWAKKRKEKGSVLKRINLSEWMNSPKEDNKEQ
jgi:hypothetical protein